jgi:hypothetical protein
MIEKLETYINQNGYPIIRRCFNCKYWHSEDKKWRSKYSPSVGNRIEEDGPIDGYCKFKPMYFSSTLSPTVYPITKEFYLCENHKLQNEEYLNKHSKKVLMKDIIKSKNEIKKSNPDY